MIALSAAGRSRRANDRRGRAAESRDRQIRRSPVMAVFLMRIPGERTDAQQVIPSLPGGGITCKA